MALTKIPASFLDKSAHVDFADSEEIRLGTGNDLRIFHAGTENFIRGNATESPLYIDVCQNLHIRHLDTDGGNAETMIKGIGDGAVELYHNSGKKFETSATGASVTGNLAVSGNLTVSGTTTELDTTNLNVTDKNITLNYHASNDTSSNADGAGITIQDAVNSSTDATISWVASSDEFAFSHPASIVNTVGGDTVLNLTGSYGSGNNVAFLGFARVGGAVAGDIRYTDATTDMEIGTSTAHKFSLKTGNTKRLTVDTAGNVGINDTNPDRKVSIIGDSTSNGKYPLSLDATNTDYTMEFRRNGQSEWWIKQSSGSFRLHENGVADHFSLKAGGNVGIGPTSPSYKLDVGHISSGEIQARFKSSGDTGYTQGAIVLESSDSGSSPETRGQGVFMFNHGTDKTWYAGTLYSNPSSYGIGVVGGSTLQTSAADDGSSLAFVIDQSRNVGIGIAAPASKLHVYSAAATSAPKDTYAVGLFDDTEGRIQVRATNSGSDGAVVGLSTGSHNWGLMATAAGTFSNAFAIGYANTSTDGNVFGVDSMSEKLVITTSGILLVGKTATGIATVGAELKPTGELLATVSGDACAFLNRKTSDGDIINFRKDGSTMGQIGTYGGALYIGSGSGGLMFNGTDIEPTSGGTGRDSNSISLGSSSYIFHDGYFGGKLSTTDMRATNYEWGSSHAIFGQDRYRIRELNNLFYGATYRYGGHGSSSANLSASMFNGNFDAGISLAANTTHVFEIDTGSTFTYPAGSHYISFYHVYNQFTSIKIEQYHVAGTYNGQWKECGAPTDFRGSAGSGGRVIKIDGFGNNYTQKYKLTIVTNSNSCVITDWAHYMTRSAGYDVNQFFKKDEESQLTRNIIFRNSAQTQVGSIVVGNSTAYNTTSDYRLKENVAPITSAATKVQQLKPIKFNFIEDETNTLIDGFLAHEVASVVPEAVTGVKDAVTPDDLYLESDPLPDGISIGDVKVAGGAINPQQLDYTKLIPVLTAALQEALDRIEVLENQ